MGLTTGHSMEDRNDRLVIQSLMRALDVLEIFTVASKPMSLGEIAKASGVTKSGVQRIAHTLVKRAIWSNRRKGVSSRGCACLTGALTICA